MPNTTRRRLLASSAATAAALATPAWMRSAHAAETIKVGALYSQTGGLSIVEKMLANGVLMAVAEINAAGGVMGRKVEVVVEDGASDPKIFNEKASKLVVRDRISTVFGCHTSASRKAVLPVFERRNAMLFYQTHYEGFECSKNVVYSGAVANQQLGNYIPWMVNKLGKKKIFIVGSNYVYPREMAKVSKKLIEQAGAQWVGDEYLELGHSEWASMVRKIKESGADAVLSNVVGDSIIAFYREYKNQGMSQAAVPICATVTGEIEIARWGPNTRPAATRRCRISCRSTRRPTSRSSSATASSSTTRRPSPTTRWRRRTSRCSCGSRRSRPASPSRPMRSAPTSAPVVRRARRQGADRPREPAWPGSPPRIGQWQADGRPRWWMRSGR